jgi:O-antigen ligase
VALATVLVLVNVNASQVHRASLAKQKVAQENIQSRLDAWSGAARLTADHPLLGVGPGNFQAYFFRATDRPSGSLLLTQVHNTYLDVASELGVIALILFVSFLAMSFSHAVKAEWMSLGPPVWRRRLRPRSSWRPSREASSRRSTRRPSGCWAL